jgi:hypothetical protein
MDGRSRPVPHAVKAGAAVALAEPCTAQSAPCLVVNPKSFGAARRGLAERASAIARAHGCEVLTTSEAPAIAATIDRLLQRGQRTIAILAGDGTVQLVAERLACASPELALPQLLVLGGGRSNVTAAEFGGCGDVLAKLETALRMCREGATLPTRERATLRIAQGAAAPRHGFLLAAGLIDCAIRACHRHRRESVGRLRASDAGTAWALARFALPLMLGLREPPLDVLHVDAPGHEPLAQPARWLFVTSLEHRFGAIDPFAARGAGPIRFTAIAARGPALWARLPRIATGRFAHGWDAARGYASGRCAALRVRGLSSYTLDGEELAADPGLPIDISPGPSLTFVSL